MRQICIIVLLISNLLSLETHDTNNTSKESLGLLKASLSDKKIDEFIEHSKTYLQNIDSSKHKEQLEQLLNTSTQRASELAADALMQLYCSKEENAKMRQRCLYWTKIAQDESFNINSALGVTYRLNIQKSNADKGFASAVAISSDGLLVSAFHNVESYESIVAVDHNKQEHNATLLFVSKEDDLAFLQIDVKDIIYARLAKEKPELGDDIYVLSAEPLLLKGIISKI